MIMNNPRVSRMAGSENMMMIGRMKVLIVVYPKFDPEDEWFD